MITKSAKLVWQSKPVSKLIKAMLGVKPMTHMDEANIKRLKALDNSPFK
jgi:hypothetical protein